MILSIALSLCLTQPAAAADTQAAAERLARGLTFETISWDDRPDASEDAFLGLHEHLRRAFPLVHEHLEREVVGRFSLVFTWRGTDGEARPALLLAHQDVVPADASGWRVPPFSGAIVDGAVWGRGAWDDKGNLFAMLEAVERLLARGFRPRRTIVLAFGHDEEMGTGAGLRGATAIAASLRARGLHFAFMLDEGLMVIDDAVPGASAPTALIGIAEKGYLTLELTATGARGHSSSPPRTSAIGQLSRALVALEDHPLPTRLDGVPRQTLVELAPTLSWPMRLVMSNLWLTSPFVEARLLSTPGSAAMLRTTTALTVLHAGDKESTVPGAATALINLRLLPGQRLDEVVEQVRAIVHQYVTVTMRQPAWEAAPPSSTTSAAYQLLTRAIHSTWPGANVAPGLMVGATDSRHFAGLADDTYRFSPIRTSVDGLARLHGVDERIAVDDYGRMIGFYLGLLSDEEGPDGP